MREWLRRMGGALSVGVAVGCSLVVNDDAYQIEVDPLGQGGAGEELPEAGSQGGSEGQAASGGESTRGGSSSLGGAGNGTSGQGGNGAGGATRGGVDGGLPLRPDAALGDAGDAGVVCSVVDGALPECCQLSCAGSECRVVPVEAGALSSAQDEGSCLRRLCDGAGGVELVPEDARCDDGVYCNGQESCSGDGVCVAGAVPCPGDDAGPECLDSCNEESRSCAEPDTAGVACDFGIGPGVCDGAGACVECRDEGDCADGDRPFCVAARCVQCIENGDCGGLTPICNEGGVCSCTDDDDCASEGVCSRGICGASGVCEQEPVARGTEVGDPIPGDCRVQQCDGNGGIESGVDDTDLPPDDGAGCSFESCSGGDPVTRFRTVGYECGAGETQCSATDRCDGNGNCLPNHRAAGTPVAVPPNDCRSHECNGSGGIRPVAGDQLVNNARCDDDDFCTGQETCTAQGSCVSPGNPCSPPRAICLGSECVECTSDAQCDGVCVDGTCVECRQPSDCGAPTAECHAFACQANRCVDTFQDPGTPCGSSAETQCSEPDTCDGAGACLPNHLSNGTACDDGQFCTVGDRCINGSCSPTANRDCRPVGGANICLESIDRCVQCTENRHCDDFCGSGRTGGCDLQSNGCRC